MVCVCSDTIKSSLTSESTPTNISSTETFCCKSVSTSLMTESWIYLLPHPPRDKLNVFSMLKLFNQDTEDSKTTTRTN